MGAAASLSTKGKGHIDAIVLCLLWSKRLCTAVPSGDFF